MLFPKSMNTVSVKILTSFVKMRFPAGAVVSAAPGSSFDEGAVPLSCSGKSFLVEHPSGQKVVFDLGFRKDVRTMSKYWRKQLESGGLKVDYGPDVAETLSSDMDLKDISAVIWRYAATLKASVSDSHDVISTVTGILIIQAIHQCFLHPPS
jgi:hypothetical protein